MLRHSFILKWFLSSIGYHNKYGSNLLLIFSKSSQKFSISQGIVVTVDEVFQKSARIFFFSAEEFLHFPLFTSISFNKL